MAAKTRKKEVNNTADIEPEGDSLIEKLLRSTILAYQTAWNTHNDEQEIKFILTITTHKVPTPDGMKRAAYLRLDRHRRSKGEEGWEPKLMHQEVYMFKDVKELLKNTDWKDQLYLNCLNRLIGAGLEYAELLDRLKQQEERPKTSEERLEDLGLVKSGVMPEPLSQADKEYADHIKQEKIKLGLE